jgi:hypothetical protein
MQSAIAQVAQVPPDLPVPAASTAPPVPPGFLDHLVTVLTSPSAAALGWVATVVGVIFGAIPLLLYFKEKRSNEAMKQLVEEFSLTQKVREKLSETQAERDMLEQESVTLLKNVRGFEADIKERLPREAKIAFLKNAIPAMEEQIHNLVVQKDNMAATLSAMDGSTLASPAAQKILTSATSIS